MFEISKIMVFFFLKCLLNVVPIDVLKRNGEKNEFFFFFIFKNSNIFECSARDTLQIANIFT